MSATADLLAYLAVLTRGSPGGYVERRYPRARGPGMRRHFFPAANLRAVAHAVEAIGGGRDVYVGVAVRARKGGDRTAVDRVDVLWVDCDDAASVAAVQRFDPQPSIVVTSSGRGCHAYWPLTAPLTVPQAERTNERLAHALGACESNVTNATAILRPPGTRNFKYDPPEPVELVRFTGESFDIGEVVGRLRDRETARPVPSVNGRYRVDDGRAVEPLLAIEPRVYVERLTGLVAGRDGKVSCPFHRDKDPSCQLYATAAAGWYCYGCRAGGDVYNFGSLLLGIALRGPAFVRLRRELYGLLLPGVPVPASSAVSTQDDRGRR